MTIDQMREKFEARFPVPEGVVFTGERYKDTGDFYFLSAFIYQSLWKAWQAAVQQAAPDGWQLVPKEPTAEMCLAAESEADANGSWPLIYAALLAAAPEV